MNKGLRDVPRSRVSDEESRAGHDRIFGERNPAPPGRTSYRVVNGELVETSRSRAVNHSPYVMEDMKEYKSPLDGTIITSRSKHKAHKRQHGVIEVGNEKLDRPMIKDYQPQGIREDMMRTIDELSKR